MPDQFLELNSCGRAWRLRKADMELLWQNMVEESEAGKRHTHEERDPYPDDERLPYWAELWPSSLALAQWLESRADLIRAKACLDMGCGLGFTALVGQWLGAQVSAMDYEEQALVFARDNALLNGIEGVRWERMDWRCPAYAAQSQDVIWAGDIMYERAFAAPISAFLEHCLAPSGRAWIAEPGRELFLHLLGELQKRMLVPRKAASLAIWPLTPQQVPVPVNIWEIRWEIGKNFSMHCAT